MQSNNRFSDKSFLQNLGFATIRSALSYVLRGLYHVFIRYCIFAGVLGSFWVMAVINPQGPLPLYIVPAALLATALVYLSEKHTTWEKILSTILLLTILGGILGILFSLFEIHEQHSGQLIPYIFVSLGVCLFGGYHIFKKRARRGISERRGGAIRVLWTVGVFYLPVFLGTIFYYRLWQNKTLESSTSILLCALAFIICLTLAIMRIFWMDALRNYRAMRVGEYPSEDAVNLLELLIPRSMFLVVMVPCLLFSEAVMFSVVYRVTYLSKNQHSHGSKASQISQKRAAPSATKKAGPSTQATQTASSPTPATSSNGYRFLAWLNFVVRPYVFPKDSKGVELDAPAWIKPFGRILLSLIILLLFTHQLNIWNLFKNCYLSLFNLVRKGAGTSDTTPELERQWSEVELNIRSLLNNYGGVWRWLILFACTSPTRWLSWKWLLDPGYAFLESVDRIYRYCKYHWGSAVIGGAVFLTVITFPIALLYEAQQAFWFSVTPSLIVGSLLMVWQRWVEPHPPQIRNWLLPWLYPAHLVVSLLYFFVSLSVGGIDHFSLWLLWYISLGTVLLYLILYWFGGERMLPPEGESLETKAAWKNSRPVRLAFLKQFYHIEHRTWVMSALIYRIHPVRSRVISARYVLPSIQLTFFQRLREYIKSLENTRQRILKSVQLGLIYNLCLLVVFTGIVLIGSSLNTSEQLGTVFWQVGITFCCALLPMSTLLSIDGVLQKWHKKKIESFELTPQLLFALLCLLTLPSTLLVYWLKATFFDNVVLQFSFLFLISFPWISFFSWRRILQHRLQRKSGQFSPSRAERPSHLGNWIELLKRKEDDALSQVYQKIHIWGRTDAFARDHMCEGLISLIQNTQKSLMTERWFSEEARELERVTHLWLGEGNIVEPEDMTKPSEGLATLLQDALDVMGSVLYDQAELQRRKMLQPHKAPDISLVIQTIERLLRLPRPPQYVSDKRGELPQSLVNLQSTLHDLEELIVFLLMETYRTSRIIDQDLCKRHNAGLLRLLRLLNEQKYHTLQQSYFSSVRVSHDALEEPAPSVSEKWERTEALLGLPTPMAAFYKEIHNSLQKLEQLKFESQKEIYVAPMHLHRSHEHHTLQDYRKSWSLEYELAKHRRCMWKNQTSLYQELLGYLLAGFKSNLPLEPEYTQWLNLQWHTPEERQNAYQCLLGTNVELPSIQFWVDLYLEAYDEDLSYTISRSSVEPSLQMSTLERLEQILQEIAPALNQDARLRWCQSLRIPRTSSLDVRVTMKVEFHGAVPQVTFVSDEDEHNDITPLLCQHSMLWTGSEPYEFRRLEIWIIRWLLELVWQASRSSEMWVPREEKENVIKYRQKNIKELQKLLKQLGNLLPMLSREDQETMDAYFARIERRIALLHRNLKKPIDETPLETSLAYHSVVQTVKSKLQEMKLLGEMRMAQLVHAGLLPSCTFQYLSKVLFAEDEALLHYQHGCGKYGTIQAQTTPPPFEQDSAYPYPM